jgi:hypothetical protein
MLSKLPDSIKVFRLLLVYFFNSSQYQFYDILRITTLLCLIYHKNQFQGKLSINYRFIYFNSSQLPVSRFSSYYQFIFFKYNKLPVLVKVLNN